MPHKDNFIVISVAFVWAILIFLAMCPGLDILAWKLLHPEGFYEQVLLVVIELVTFGPRVLVGALAATVFAKMVLGLAE
jgi:hypothetical protein